MRYILLNPGPVSISDKVREAAVQDDLSHREPEYIELQERVREALTSVYDCNPANWTSILLGGSGTSALEAMLTSLCPRKARLLVVENGPCGERINRIAGIHDIETDTVAHSWTEAIDFDRVKAALDGGLYTHLVAVHHETTTGRLNDVAALARLCEAHGVGLLLDAVSSFGAEYIPFESKALVACAATAGRCLHGIPGLSFVICRNTALANFDEPPRSLGLDLGLAAEMQSRPAASFTPPVNAVVALDTALSELLDEGGWSGRHAAYARRSKKVRRVLASHGVDTFLPPGDTSCALSTYRLPQGMTIHQVHRALKLRGFVINSGQGKLKPELFPIAVMGNFSRYDMERLLAALQEVFGATGA